MKTLILLLFVLLAFGCRKASESKEEQASTDTLGITDTVYDGANGSMGAAGDNAFAEFSASNGTTVFRLRDWKSKLNLSTLGTPKEILSRELTLTTDTYRGAMVEQYQWDDLNLEFFRPKDNSDSWLMTIEIKGGPWSTARGIKVGDSLTDLKNMYPKVAELADDKDQYSYSYTIDDSALMFRVITDNVDRIKMQYMLK